MKVAIFGTRKASRYQALLLAVSFSDTHLDVELCSMTSNRLKLPLDLPRKENIFSLHSLSHFSMNRRPYSLQDMKRCVSS